MAGKSRLWICESCNTASTQPEVRWVGEIPHCAHCNAALTVQIRIPSGTAKDPDFGQLRVPRSPVRMPPWFRIKEQDGELEISYRLRDSDPEEKWRLLAIPVLTSVFLLCSRTEIGGFGWGLVALLTLLCLYFLGVQQLSRTSIRVAAGKLTVFSRPLPLRGKFQLTTADIHQLYSQRQVYEHRYRSLELGETVIYQVYALAKDWEPVCIVSGLREMDEALFIEQELERFLGIPDAAVCEELERQTNVPLLVPPGGARRG